MERNIEFITNHWMLCIAFVVVSYLLVQELFDNVFKHYKAINSTQAVAQLNNIETIILDVSETKDFNKGHITDSINLPWAKLEKDISPLEKYKDMPMLVLCQTGARSAPACKQLYKKGFYQIINLSGGIQAWEDQKLPVDRTKSKNNQHG